MLLGPKYKVFLKMIEIEAVVPSLEGSILEIEDCASPYFAGALATSDPKVGFKDADIVLLVGGKPRLPGMERKDLLVDNAKIFRDQGIAINEVAKENVKIVVVGNPANTNALILSKYAPRIPKKNISSLTRLDLNRAFSTLAQEFLCDISEVRGPIVWGNHSSSLCLDLTNVTVNGKKPEGLDAKANDLQQKVQFRGAQIMNKRGKSSCYSAAKAICDQIRDWVLGTGEGKHVSMGIFPEGNKYGIPEHLNFSCPVECKDGEWKIVEGLTIAESTKAQMALNIKELEDEREIAQSIDGN
jgi:malate dehydrogenase